MAMERDAARTGGNAADRDQSALGARADADPPAQHAVGEALRLIVKLTKTLSNAFFKVPGMLWRYSGVMIMKASASLILRFQRRTIGSE